MNITCLLWYDRREEKEGGKMSIERAKEYLKQYGLAERIQEPEMSSATVKEAALALGCKEKEIAKTLSFYVEDRPILIVTAGDQKIDNSKYKAQFHTKAKMIPFEEVEEKIGHAVGGVCPFGINPGVEVYLDISLQRFPFVYPACGSSNSGIKLSMEELEKVANATGWIDVCKTMEG